MTKMMSLAEAAKLIQDGQYLYIAATENCLTQLPLGNWIGGTIPYFMTPTGGMVSHDQALVTVLPQQITRCAIMSYNEDKLYSIQKNYL